MSLVRNLPESEHAIDLFGPELDRYTYSSGLESVSYTGVPVSDSLLAERLWHFGAFSSFARKQKYDAALFPAGVKLMPFHFDVPSVVVIQNILSDVYQKSDDGMLTGLLKMQLNKAHRIIAASRFIRDDLINLRIPESKITVIHNGIDTNLFFPRPVEQSDTVLIHPFSIRRPYIIYASRVAYPAKCHIELLRAFAIFKQKTGLPHRLVLAGADGVNAEIVHREIIKSPYASDILLTGYFPHQNLPELYSAADACVFPSSIEGVGLPVLEAMACGIPVACARAGALPEMAGDSAFYFDPNSPDEIAAAIEKVVRLPDGSTDAFRAELSARGIEWVKNFDWKKCAAETLSCLESVVR